MYDLDRFRTRRIQNDDVLVHIASNTCKLIYSIPTTLYVQLLQVEYEAPNLNRLPLRCIRRAGRIIERRMRCQTSSVLLRVVALDQSHLIRTLSAQVIPRQPLVVSYAEGATLSVWVDEAHGYEVLLLECTPVCDRKRFVCDGVTDGPPDVDDADSAFEEAFCVGAEVAVDTLHGRLECLVNVNAFLS